MGDRDGFAGAAGARRLEAGFGQAGRQGLRHHPSAQGWFARRTVHVGGAPERPETGQWRAAQQPAWRRVKFRFAYQLADSEKPSGVSAKPGVTVILKLL